MYKILVLNNKGWYTIKPNNQINRDWLHQEHLQDSCDG